MCACHADNVAGRGQLSGVSLLLWFQGLKLRSLDVVTQQVLLPPVLLPPVSPALLFVCIFTYVEGCVQVCGGYWSASGLKCHYQKLPTVVLREFLSSLELAN